MLWLSPTAAHHTGPLFAVVWLSVNHVLTTSSLLFFRLAAETLAGLNSMQPCSSGDHPRSASAGFDVSSDESLPLLTRKLSKHPAVARQRSRKMASSHEPAVHASSVAAAHAYGSGAFVHPVLGLYVPDAWRSYHRDGTASGAKASLMASSEHFAGRAPNGQKTWWAARGSSREFPLHHQGPMLQPWPGGDSANLV